MSQYKILQRLNLAYTKRNQTININRKKLSSFPKLITTSGMHRLQWQKNCFTVVRFIAGRKRLRQGNLLIQIYQIEFQLLVSHYCPPVCASPAGPCGPAAPCSP